MRKIFFFLAYTALMATVLSSCNMFCEKGTGSLTTEIRDVLEFDEIELDGAAKVFINQGTNVKVEVEIDSNLLEFVKTKVSGMKLKIYDDKCLEEFSKYEIHITVPDLTGLYVSGNVNVKSEGLIKTDNLYLKIKDSGIVHFGVKTDDLEVVTKDSGSINLFGSAENFEIDIDDAGSVDAFGLSAKNVDTDVDDAGICKINVSSKFKGDVSGSGKIFYKGNPKKVKTSTSDSGSIKAK